MCVKIIKYCILVKLPVLIDYYKSVVILYVVLCLVDKMPPPVKAGKPLTRGQKILQMAVLRNLTNTEHKRLVTTPNRPKGGAAAKRRLFGGVCSTPKVGVKVFIVFVLTL